MLQTPNLLPDYLIFPSEQEVPGGGGQGTTADDDDFTGRRWRWQIHISMQGRGMEADDISKIVYMGPREAKRIGIVLDAEPRAMMVNTLFAKNIPGELTMPINDIVKSKDVTKEFQGEEKLASIPPFTDPSEIIVDNEDPGFISSKLSTVSPLKKLLGIKNKTGKSYMQISMWDRPEYWQPIVLTSYYGKYIRSSVYTRGGTGDKTITWKGIIKQPGYYDVYTYVGKTGDRMMVMVRGGWTRSRIRTNNQQREESQFKDMHFKIYHDEGIEDITLDYENAEAGWNTLGRYYLTPDTVKVVLTNQSAGRVRNW